MAKKAAPKAAAKAAPAPPPPPPPPPPAPAPKAKAAKPKKPDRPKPHTKSEVYAIMADKTGLGKKQVSDFFDALVGVVETDLSAAGPGVFNLPNLLKIEVIVKPAVPAKKGINPATLESITIAAKPERNAVRVRPNKSLKDYVASTK